MKEITELEAAAQKAVAAAHAAAKAARKAGAEINPDDLAARCPVAVCAAAPQEIQRAMWALRDAALAVCPLQPGLAGNREPEEKDWQNSDDPRFAAAAAIDKAADALQKLYQAKAGRAGGRQQERRKNDHHH